MAASRCVQEDLIYDIGLHTGGDTAYYLYQGYRVVAIEADPELARRAQARFARQISAGRLIVLNVGIAEKPGLATFWICEKKPDWNSLHRRLASRRGSPHHAIEVPTRRLDEILEQYGRPCYLKIDIEGNDHLCVNGLIGHLLPRFISLEAECLGEQLFLTESGSLNTLNLLRAHGYGRFKLIYQRDFSAIQPSPRRRAILETRMRSWKFELGDSGPWGDDTPGPGLSYEDVKTALAYAVESGVESWHDWHART